MLSLCPWNETENVLFHTFLLGQGGGRHQIHRIHSAGQAHSWSCSAFLPWYLRAMGQSATPFSNECPRILETPWGSTIVSGNSDFSGHTFAVEQDLVMRLDLYQVMGLDLYQQESCTGSGWLSGFQSFIYFWPGLGHAKGNSLTSQYRAPWVTPMSSLLFAPCPIPASRSEHLI